MDVALTIRSGEAAMQLPHFHAFSDSVNLKSDLAAIANHLGARHPNHCREERRFALLPMASADKLKHGVTAKSAECLESAFIENHGRLRVCESILRNVCGKGENRV
jgi:hypothetical protein